MNINFKNYVREMDLVPKYIYFRDIENIPKDSSVMKELRKNLLMHFHIKKL